jgi:hypothetical protein
MDMRHLKRHIKSKINKKACDNVVKLYTKDFSCGTYRIKKPGIYVLKENIKFDPNPDDNWFPTRDQLLDEYKHSAFFLGFFAAITIECSHVKIDLNCHTIEQSPMHALQQRFFQTIQLNDSPFILNQGPSKTFANSGFVPSEYIWICGGKMDLSTHYCIHGNSNSNILIESVDMRNFETGGIALNQVKNVVIDGCHIGSTRKDTPVTASYSVLRNIIILFKNRKIDCHMNLEFKGKSGNHILKKLLKLENTIIKNYKRSGYRSVLSQKCDKYNYEIEKYIHNSTGINDGSSIVGIQITPRGVAIKAFEGEKICPSAECVGSIDNYSETIYIHNVNINNIHSNPVEVVSCKNGNKNVVGAMGELMNVGSVISEKYVYVSSIINDAHCWLAKLYNMVEKSKLPISTISIPEFMVDFAENDKNIMKIDHSLVLRYGLDIMGHVNKGAMALRLGGCVGVHLSDICISCINNHGKPSNVENRPEYGKEYVKEKNNVSEELGMWYSGNISYGIIFSSSKKITLCNVNVSDVSSETGKYYEYFYNDTNQKEINYV